MAGTHRRSLGFRRACIPGFRSVGAARVDRVRTCAREHARAAAWGWFGQVVRGEDPGGGGRWLGFGRAMVEFVRAETRCAATGRGSRMCKRKSFVQNRRAVAHGSGSHLRTTGQWVRDRAPWRPLADRTKSLAPCHEPAAESRMALTDGGDLRVHGRMPIWGSAGTGSGRLLGSFGQRGRLAEFDPAAGFCVGAGAGAD